MRATVSPLRRLIVWWASVESAPANNAKAAEPRAIQAAEDSALEVAIGHADEVGKGTGLLAPSVLHKLWQAARAELVEVTETEFGAALEAIGVRQNFGLEPGKAANEKQREAFWTALHLEDLALARGCALGREAAWRRFMTEFRGPLTRAAQGLTQSAALGEELADAIYAELFGFEGRDGARRSPLERYSGRGSLMSWLRAMLAQQNVNRYRKTYRETSLEDVEAAAPAPADPEESTLAHLGAALPDALARLTPEERFLLSGYYLDGHTLLEMSRVLGAHESTVSRKLNRVTREIRKQLQRALAARGLSRRAAEEALGIDPRDVNVNLRKLLQNPAGKTYSVGEG